MLATSRITWVSVLFFVGGGRWGSREVVYMSFRFWLRLELVEFMRFGSFGFFFRRVVVKRGLFWGFFDFV